MAESRLPPLPEESTRPSKLMSAREAVEQFVDDGDSVFLGYTSWAGAFEREIARQRKRDLTAIATVGSLLLPLAGCANRLITAYALGRLAEVPGLRVFGPPPSATRLGPVSFELDGVHGHDVAEILDRHGVAVRAGHHCAQPLMDRLGVAATARASFGIYTVPEEIDRLIDGLLDARQVFGL